jgi:hypothetical protein
MQRERESERERERDAAGRFAKIAATRKNVNPEYRILTK